MMPLYTIAFLGLLVGAQSKSVELSNVEYRPSVASRVDSLANDHRAVESSQLVDSSRAGLSRDEVAAAIASSRDGKLLLADAQALNDELSRRGLYRPYALLPRPNIYRGRLYSGLRADDLAIGGDIRANEPVLHLNQADELVNLLVGQRDGNIDHAAAVLRSVENLNALHALQESITNRGGSQAVVNLDQVADALSRADVLQAVQELVEPAIHSRHGQDHAAAILERANTLKALNDLQGSVAVRSGEPILKLAVDHAAHGAERVDSRGGVVGGQSVRLGNKVRAPCPYC
ncbi:unnamed protein product [Euphydryas editha]|uniref:Uncharacterized protein n=1 Tax=Euphydryas editha TaxID=104508 RepID=A0AAU9UHK6_EUPED|nr:unnamed protein product [Euphydryas editha]